MQHGIFSGNTNLQYDSEDKNTLTKSQSSWTAISLGTQSREKHDGIGGADWELNSEIWIHTSGIDSAERGRSGILCSGERMSSWTVLEI